MTDSAGITSTHDAIRQWRIACQAKPEASTGYPRTNILWRAAHGAGGIGAATRSDYMRSHDDLADDPEIVRMVACAVGYMRWSHEAGLIPNLHDPFLAYHLHLIRGDRAIRYGKPYPISAKARILGIGKKTFYDRVTQATQYIHDFLGD